MTAVAVKPSVYVTGFCSSGSCARCTSPKCTHDCHAAVARHPAAHVSPAATSAPAVALVTTPTNGRTPTVLELLPIDKIVVDPVNRAVVEDDDLRALAASIGEVGVLQPVVVSPNGEGTYHLVAGARRLAASRLAGRDDVPAMVEARDETGRAVARAVENLHRLDLTPMQEAREYSEMARLGLSQRDIARRCAVSQSHVSKALSLLKLPDDVQGEVDSGVITRGDAMALAGLAKDDQRDALKARERGGTEAMASTIERARREQEREAARAAVAKKLAAEGIKVIANSSGCKRLGAQHYDGLRIDAKAHAAEPCHRAVVGWGGDIATYCSDWKRHNAKGESALKVKPEPKRSGPAESASAKDERERRLAEQAREKEAAEARTAFIKTLLPTKAPKGDPALLDAIRTGLRPILDWGDTPGFDLAIDWCPIELPKGSDRWARRAEAALEYCSTPLGMARFFTALAYGYGEEELDGYNGWDPQSVGVAHLKKLVELGYQPTEYEAEKLTPPAKKPAPRKSTARKAAIGK